MDLLRDWLAPTIQDELSHALQWKEAAPNVQQRFGEKASYSDDGSNLRMQSSKNGVVQISKFVDFKPPIQAILSDKTTRIGARISSSATRQYEEQHTRSFTKDTTGGLIQILEFEIVATHLGPRSDRLTLLVNRFKSLGSNGSGAFSVPRPIESPDKGCFALLDKLMGIRAQEKATSSQDHSTRESSEAVSSIHSQMGLLGNNDDDDDDDAAIDSRVMFATQIPSAMESHSLRRQNSVAQSPSNIGVKDASKALNNPSQATEVVRTPADGSTKLVESKIASEAIVETKSSINARNLVLAINKEYEARPIIMKKLARNQLVEKSAVEEAEVTKLLQDQYEDAGLELAKEFDQHRMGRTCCTLPSAEMKTTIKGSLVKPKFATELENLHDHNTDDITTSPISQDRSSKKRKLDDRISSRDVRISKDQETLLSRPDSWLPADPNQREPQANMPITLLETFNRKADLHADCGLNGVSESQKAPPTDEVVTLGGDEASDANASISITDSDIDSEQWPPSPNRGQLPPDSTPPALGYSGEQSEVSELRDSRALGPSLVSLQPKVDPQNSLQESISLEQSNGNDEGSSAEVTDQGPLLSSSIVHASPQQSVHGSTQHQTLQLVARANESHFPLETQAKAQTKDGLLSLEVTHSSCSTTDSDIEMAAPVPLDIPMQSQSHIPPQESLPSTAAQAKQPFTQVKRTPYPTSNDCNSSTRSFMDRSRPNGDEEHKTPQEKFEQRSMWIPSTASIFESRPNSFSLSSLLELSSKDSTSYSIKSRGTSVEQANASARHAAGIRTSRLEGEEVVLKAIDANWNLDNVQGEEMDDLPKPGNKTPKIGNIESSLHIPVSGKRVLQTDEADDASTDGRHFSKRGKTKPSFLYPNQSSRRGKIQIPPALIISDIPDELPDPAISARQHREDWFAARRSSESSAAKNSPISPPKGHVMSTSSLADRSTQSSSGLATPCYNDDYKTTRENAFTNSLSTPILAEEAGSYNANSPQRAAQELLNEKDIASSPAPEIVQIHHNTMNSPASRNIQTPGIIGAIKIPQDEMNYDARLIFKSPRASAALQTLSSDIQAPQNEHSNVSASTAAYIVNVLEQPERSEAVAAQRLPDAFPSLAPVEANQVETISPSQSTFRTFKDAYPEYAGDIKHFLALCKKIEKLWKRKSLHKSMWDDFLIRNKSDYARHVQKCMEDGDDPMPYDRFYNDEIDEPSYRKKVLTPQNLESIIYASDDGNHVLTRDIRAATTPITTNLSSMNTGAIIKASPSLERTQKATVMIDLTDDHQGEIITSKKGTGPQSESPMRSSSQRQGSRIADSNAQMSRTLYSNFPPIISQRQPTPLSSQGLPQSATCQKNLDTRTDAVHRRAQILFSPKTDSEMPPTRGQEQISAELKGKCRETRVDKTSSMPKKAPFKDPRADTRLEGQDQDSHSLWWQDENTPFKTFVRSYLAIRPGNGNAFAKHEDIAWVQRKYESKVRKLRHLDVLGWSLLGELT